MELVVKTAAEIDLFEVMYADPEMRPIIDAWIRKKYPDIDFHLAMKRLREREPKGCR